MFAHRTRLACAIAAALALLAVGNPAHATFSERVIQQIEDARNSHKSRNFDDALDQYNRAAGAAVGGSPETMRKALLGRAALFETIQQFAQAEADLTSALQVRPVDPSLYADRGYFYMRQNRMPDALSDFLSGVRLAPDHAKFYYGAGRVQAALENFSAAIDFYSDAIAADPKDSKAYLSRAEAQVRLGNWIEARADYDRALALGLERRGDGYFARLGRGYVLLMLNQYKAAIADLDVAVTYDPTAVRGLAWRGYANERLGRLDLAIADAERAATANQSDPALRQTLDRLRSRGTTAPATRERAELP